MKNTKNIFAILITIMVHTTVALVAYFYSGELYTIIYGPVMSPMTYNIVNPMLKDISANLQFFQDCINFRYQAITIIGLIPMLIGIIIWIKYNKNVGYSIMITSIVLILILILGFTNESFIIDLTRRVPLIMGM